MASCNCTGACRRTGSCGGSGYFARFGPADDNVVGMVCDKAIPTLQLDTWPPDGGILATLFTYDETPWDKPLALDWDLDSYRVYDPRWHPGAPYPHSD